MRLFWSTCAKCRKAFVVAWELRHRLTVPMLVVPAGPHAQVVQPWGDDPHHLSGAKCGFPHHPARTSAKHRARTGFPAVQGPSLWAHYAP